VLIDSHAHINLPIFNSDRDQVLTRAWQQGVSAIINVGIDLESSRESVHIAQSHPDIFTTVGFHPNNTHEMKEGDLDLLSELADNPKVVAIGETGLDFYRKSSPRHQQLEAFQQQLNLATRLSLPVVIHCRNAYTEMLDIIAHWVKSKPHVVDHNNGLGVIHCFSGDVILAHHFISLGFLISLPGSLTYPSANAMVEVALELPLDKLLVETDSPFLAPQRYRGQRNEPSYVSLVVDKIAEVRQVPAEMIAHTTAQNAINLFHLPIN
jgi:TatD DNase family protein